MCQGFDSYIDSKSTTKKFHTKHNELKKDIVCDKGSTMHCSGICSPAQLLSPLIQIEL